MIKTATRNPALNKLDAGFVTQDGTRYALLSSRGDLRQDGPLQLAIIPPNGEPTYFNVTREHIDLARSGTHTLNVENLGEMRVGRFGAELDTPFGQINMRYNNRP